MFAMAGLIVRIAYVVWIATRYGVQQFSDFHYLHQLASSLAVGNGFTIEGVRIFNQSVGYPAFLAPFYAVFGATPWTAIIVNVLLGAVSVGLVYLLALRLFRTAEWSGEDTQPCRCSVDRMAAYAAMVACIYPDSLLYCGLVAAENLLIPLMLSLLVAVVHPWRNAWVEGAMVGAVAAATASAKANVLVVCLFIPLLWRCVRGTFVKQTLAAALVGLVCLTPWTVANYRASGRVIPFAAVAGSALLDGTNPEASGKPTSNSTQFVEIGPGMSEVDLNDARMRKALSFIKADPGWFVKLSFKKLVHAFSPARDFMFEQDSRPRLPTRFVSRWGPTGFNALLLLGVVAGLWCVRKQRAVFLVGVSLIAAPTVLQVIFFAYSRYRFPFLFCLLPVVVVGWRGLWEWCCLVVDHARDREGKHRGCRPSA